MLLRRFCRLSSAIHRSLLFLLSFPRLPFKQLPPGRNRRRLRYYYDAFLNYICFLPVSGLILYNKQLQSSKEKNKRSNFVIKNSALKSFSSQLAKCRVRNSARMRQEQESFEEGDQVLEEVLRRLNFATLQLAVGGQGWQTGRFGSAVNQLLFFQQFSKTKRRNLPQMLERRSTKVDFSRQKDERNNIQGKKF